GLIYSGIVFNNDFRRVVLATDGQLHDVGAGFQRQSQSGESTEATTATASASAAATAATKSTSRTRRRIATKVPLNPVKTSILRAGDVAHHFAGVIGDRDLHVAAWRRLQVVADGRARLRVTAAEKFRSAPVSSEPRI